MKIDLLGFTCELNDLLGFAKEQSCAINLRCNDLLGFT